MDWFYPYIDSGSAICVRAATMASEGVKPYRWDLREEAYED